MSPVCEHILTLGNALWVKKELHLPLTLEQIRKGIVCVYEHAFPYGQEKTTIEKYSLREFGQRFVTTFCKLARLPAVLPGMLG